jgi:phosphatidylglycerophosphate synthase
LNRSFLAELERPALAWLVRRLPARATPNHLTALGLLGAVATAAGFAACHVSNGFLVFVVLGLAANWYGDSLDGTLARHRKIERPHYGYFVDHASDLIAQTLIIVGLGFSPYFTLFSALLVLSMYLLISSYTYLKVMVAQTHQLSYGGMGATEFRLLVALWALAAAFVGPALTQTPLFGHAALDVAIGVLWALTFAAFVYVVRADLLDMDETKKAEPKTERAPQAGVVPNA